jgi:hypothetical protein
MSCLSRAQGRLNLRWRFEWATGLPMTAYLSTKGVYFLLTNASDLSPALLGNQGVALGERPRARDVQDIGVALDVLREPRKLGTTSRRFSPPRHRDPAAGTAVDVDGFDAAIAFIETVRSRLPYSRCARAASG